MHYLYKRKRKFFIFCVFMYIAQYTPCEEVDAVKIVLAGICNYVVGEVSCFHFTN